MAWKTLILGIGMSLGVFGIKAGAGLYGGLLEKSVKRNGWKVYLFIAMGYALVFSVSAATLRAVHLMDHLDTLLRWLEAGMLVHVLLAVLMLVWGLVLKQRRISPTRRRSGWWLLAFPCPVCMTVIGISMSFVMALFPDALVKTTVLLYCGFMGMVLGTVLVLSRWGQWVGRSSEETLADAMLILAAYFLLSVLIMPQFAGIDEISRMGAKSGELHHVDGYGMAGMAVAVLFLFGLGYKRMDRQCKRERLLGPADDAASFTATISRQKRHILSIDMPAYPSNPESFQLIKR